MRTDIKQSELLNIIKSEQSKQGLTDAALVSGVMEYQRYWRVKSHGVKLYYEEAIGLLNNLGYQVQAVVPEQRLLLNANNPKI